MKSNVAHKAESPNTASLFMNGRSQAVRLPKEYRFAGKKVSIEKKGDMIILRPLEREWDEKFWNSLGSLTRDFEKQKVKKQKRERLFK